MNIGLALRKLRKGKGINQTIFAERCGITQTYVSNIEKGLKKPSLPVLEKMASVLDMPLPILFWFTITESDIQPEKLSFYNLVRPVMDNFLEELFTTQTNLKN